MQSGNMSMASETSSKFNEESRMKIDILMSAFEELGWDSQKDLTQKEILLFLNRLSKQGQFDQTLAQKLFQVLDVNNQNQITVEEFIKGYLQFEADLKKNNDEFNKKYIQEQNNYNNLEEQCRLYKSEKLSPEGFCENAKITVEITDVDIQKEIEGINIDCRKINPEKLEKDDDLNGHVDFIYSCSNIRTRNYNIKEIEKQKLKMIAGRIVPAMATTTAAITGIACLQIYISEIAI